MSDSQPGFLDFIRLVLNALEAAEVEYMIGGAVAVWAWGEARTTQDFDLVVNLPIHQVVRLSGELERRSMLVPPDIILDLLLQEEGDLPVNAIHLKSGYKAELFLLRPGDAFRENALARRKLVDMGVPVGSVFVHAPEDLILNKIHYYSLSYQSKHVRDIASIIVISHDIVDTDYIARWSAELGFADTWAEIQEQIAGMWN